jgi:hypothetical protein
MKKKRIYKNKKRMKPNFLASMYQWLSNQFQSIKTKYAEFANFPQLVLLLAISQTILLTSCEKIEGIGPVVSETRAHSGFDGLRVSICGNVDFQIANTYSVVASAPENILEKIETKVNNGELVIKWDRPLRIVDCDEITIRVSGPDLEHIGLSGSSEIKVTGRINHRNMDIEISGSGSVLLEELELANALDVLLSGSGNLTVLNGFSTVSDLAVSGSGNLDLGNVKMERAEAHISGGGNIKVQVSKFLQARISGSGDVLYRGNPEIDSKVSGSGKVKKID